MKRLLIAAALLGLVVACTKKPADDAAATPPAQATNPAAQTAPAPKPSATAAETYEFAFTGIDDKAEKDPRVVKWEDGPCGATPVARVDRIPLQDSALQPDYVVEYDGAGKEIRRWGKPYEARVLGIDGDRLMFRVGYDAPQDYWTDTTGAIGRIEGDAAKPAAKTLDETATTLECPALPTFSKSDYEQCYDVADRAGGKHRMSWEAACT